MNLSMYNEELLHQYKSPSQRARVLTEKWYSSEMYCPCCLNQKINDYPNNKKGYDFYCPKCGNNFQLKSSKKPIRHKINDGEYNTMASIIQSGNSPNFVVMNYSNEDWIVKNLMMIPKFFVTFSMLEKRKPLSINARRHGWTGCNFLLNKLPSEGKIPIIQSEKVLPKKEINKTWQKMFFLATKKPEFRGWTSDVLRCVEEIGEEEFTLQDVYKFEKELKELHPNNNNVKPKIRQQLQILRDNKVIRFDPLNKGIYSMIH